MFSELAADNAGRLAEPVDRFRILGIEPSATGPRRRARLHDRPALRAELEGVARALVTPSEPGAGNELDLLVLQARVSIAGRDGGREVPVASFFRGFAQTALEPGELITAVSVPAPPPGAGGAYVKFSALAADSSGAPAPTPTSARGSRPSRA